MHREPQAAAWTSAQGLGCCLALEVSPSRIVFGVVASEFFGVVEGVGSCSGLAVVEVGWGDPFGIGVGAFSGYRDGFNGRSGNTW